MKDDIKIVGADTANLRVVGKTYYKVNTDKIETIEDIKLILKHLDLSYSPESKEEYEVMKHLLILN
tara:strand:+ start:3865 stop:4062 length:198 start_codon:yes stop_codon:yes gene_type:complete